jgi:hypothetical protein
MANPFIGLLSTPANGAKPPINVALLNTNPFSVPNKIPRGVIELVVRVPDVTEGIPVELALKVAEPVPIAVIVTVHEFAAVDKVQLLADKEITAGLLLLSATIADSPEVEFVILIVAVVDSPTSKLDSANAEIDNVPLLILLLFDITVVLPPLHAVIKLVHTTKNIG